MNCQGPTIDKHRNYHVNFDIGEKEGVPTLTITSCSSTVGDVDFKFHGGASWLYNLFKHYVEETLKKSLQANVSGSDTAGHASQSLAVAYSAQNSAALFKKW